MSSTKYIDFDESDQVDNIFRAAHFALIFMVSVLILVYLRKFRVQKFRNACKRGKVVEIYQILQTPLAINNILGLSSEELSIGLMWACSNGHIKIMELLLRVDVVFQNKFSLASSVMCACKRGNLDAVKLLLKDSRVPIDIINKEGLAPEQITKVPEIKTLIRSEHWKRIHLEIDKISEQVRSTVESLRDQNCVSENDVYLDTLRVKLNELSAKTKLLETKEKVELDRLFKHFRKEEIEVHSKYEAETQYVRTSIEDDIRKLKSIMS